MEALARCAGGMRVFLWRLGRGTRGLIVGERVPTEFSNPPAYGQTQSPSGIVLPGTPPSSFWFQATE